MIIGDKIKKTINSFEPGVVFSISDFGFDPQYDLSLAKALSRMASKGELCKLSKGKYYKPKQTLLGVLKPSTIELVKDFLKKDGKLTGYITGVQAFSQMGLTTQISSSILIGTNKYRRAVTRGEYTVKFLQQNNPIIEEDLELLRILDALKLIREIPAITPNDACGKIVLIVKALPKEKQVRLEELSLQYTNFVRALVGAIYEYLGLNSETVRRTLNGVTKYQLPISRSTLPTKENWNIYETLLLSKK